MSTGPWEGGKGSRPRKYKVDKYLENYERIFGNAARKGKEQGSNQSEHHEGESSRSSEGSGSSDSVQQGR
jgi:hypothetical protein